MSGANNGQGKLCFLIVDDNEKTLRWLINGIRRSGKAEATYCAKVEDAIAALRRTAYDYIILDWRMSEGSGQILTGADIMNALAADGSANRDTPVILVTAHPASANSEVNNLQKRPIRIFSKLHPGHMRRYMGELLQIDPADL